MKIAPEWVWFWQNQGLMGLHRRCYDAQINQLGFPSLLKKPHFCLLYHTFLPNYKLKVFCSGPARYFFVKIKNSVYLNLCDIFWLWQHYSSVEIHLRSIGRLENYKLATVKIGCFVPDLTEKRAYFQQKHDQIPCPNHCNTFFLLLHLYLLEKTYFGSSSNKDICNFADIKFETLPFRTWRRKVFC